MRQVIIESPYAGAGRWFFQRWINRLLNIRYARKAMADCFSRGESPYASHLLYPQVLNDNCIHERAKGIQAGLGWGRSADATVVYADRGISLGMRYGIEAAGAAGRSVEMRTLKKAEIEVTDDLVAASAAVFLTSL